MRSSDKNKDDADIDGTFEYGINKIFGRKIDGRIWQWPCRGKGTDY